MTTWQHRRVPALRAGTPTAPSASTSSPTSSPTPHACNTQLHGCDRVTTYCQAASGGGAGYTCECRQGYQPTSSSTLRCDPTLSPSQYPTSYPTSAQPTISPTSAPTPHVCNTQLYNCDLLTTYCEPAGTGYICACRRGYVPSSTSTVRCIATPSPSHNPTIYPTSHPTPHVCNTQLHGCDLLTTYCQAASGSSTGYTCECRQGYLPTSSSTLRCDPTLSPSQSPTTRPSSNPTVIPTIAPSSNPTVTPTSVPTDAPTARVSDASSGGASSTTTYSLFAVIAICVIAVAVLLVIVRKHRQRNNADAGNATASGASSFANPMYEGETAANSDPSYMQVDPDVM
jgi:hypothetical protein